MPPAARGRRPSTMAIGCPDLRGELVDLGVDAGWLATDAPRASIGTIRRPKPGALGETEGATVLNRVALPCCPPRPRIRDATLSGDSVATVSRSTRPGMRS